MTLLVVALGIALVQACKEAGSPCACVNKPHDHKYYLTEFDGSTCSCGQCHEYGEYFAADRQRFGCGTHLHVCRNGKCVKLRVTDYGPSCFVERDAGRAVLDASPATCKELTGGSSCGWSDHFSITVTEAEDPAVDGRPCGPFNVTDEELADLIENGRKIEERKRMQAVNTTASLPSSSIRVHRAPKYDVVVPEFMYTESELAELRTNPHVQWHSPAPDNTPIPHWASLYGQGQGLNGSKVSITRSHVIKRANDWVEKKKPYCQCNSDCCGTCDMCHEGNPPYRCDCSGFVSHSWELPGGLVTQTLHTVGHYIEKKHLKKGDVMLYAAEHVVIFNGWTSDAETHYHAIQEPGCHSSLPPYAVANIEPYPMSWNPSDFKPFRYNNIVDG